MKCPQCQATTRVYITQSMADGSTRRSRECLGPHPHRFLTFEILPTEIDSLRSRAFKYERLRLLVLDEMTK